MKRLPLLLLFLLTVTWMIWSAPSRAEAFAGSPLTPTLYPPTNLAAEMIECHVLLHWQKPQITIGTTPPGLIGYNIYEEGAFVHYVGDPDSMMYFCWNMPTFGSHSYTVTAKYDLTPYGWPGQFGESAPAGPASIFNWCVLSLQFYEPWDLGVFTYQDWQFEPSQGNWIITTSIGNPLPAAVFNGTPGAAGYDFLMKSDQIYALPWNCADISLEFDYQLNDLTAGGTEKLAVQYCTDDSTWVTVTEIYNTGTTVWKHQKFDITPVHGTVFRIGFRLQGQNSQNIGSWLIDNILVSPHCFGPEACSYTRNGNMIHLFWQPMACDSMQYSAGYNVYRTDGVNGLPPFLKLNGPPVTSLEFNDMIPSGITSAVFRYMITALQKDPVSGDFLCEAPSDTLYVDYITGIDRKENSFFQIIPTPATDWLSIVSPYPMERCDLLTILGETVRSQSCDQKQETRIGVSDLGRGVYLLRISALDREYLLKVVIAR